MREALELSTLAEKELWLEAIQKELEAMQQTATWKPVKKNFKKGMKPLPTHVLRIKRNADGLPIQFKARIVAGGNF